MGGYAAGPKLPGEGVGAETLWDRRDQRGLMAANLHIVQAGVNRYLARRVSFLDPDRRWLVRRRAQHARLP